MVLAMAQQLGYARQVSQPVVIQLLLVQWAQAHQQPLRPLSPM